MSSSHYSDPLLPRRSRRLGRPAAETGALVDSLPRPSPSHCLTDRDNVRPVVSPVAPMPCAGRPTGPLRGDQRHYPRGWVGPVIATALAVALCLLSLLGPLWWDGHRRVNVPISRLGPENVRIVEQPAPVSDISELALRYSALCYEVNNPASRFNISVDLDAPGLRHFHLRSGLPALPQHKGFGWVRPLVPRPAEDRSGLGVHRNLTLMTYMLLDFWQPLMYAAYGLLEAGLGLQHPEFAALSDAMFMVMPPKSLWDVLFNLPHSWDSLLSQACESPTEAFRFLVSFRDTLGGYKTPPWDWNRVEEGRVGSHAPSPQQLLDLERADTLHNAGGRRPTLPQLLAGIGLTRNASILLEMMDRRLEKNNDALGMNKYSIRGRYHPDWCWNQTFLAEIAQGRCHGNEMWIFFSDNTYTHPPDFFTRGQMLLWIIAEGLCGVDKVMRPLATAVVRIRDRVQAAIDERVDERRAGRSAFETLMSYFYPDPDDLVRQMGAVNRGLDAFHPLLASLDLQHQLLAGVARSLLQTCQFQDALGDRVRALAEDQTARWSLGWDAENGVAVVTFATFPELKDAELQVDAELGQLRTDQQRARYYSDRQDLQRQWPGMPQIRAWLRRLGFPRVIDECNRRNPNWGRRQRFYLKVRQKQKAEASSRDTETGQGGGDQRPSGA